MLIKVKLRSPFGASVIDGAIRTVHINDVVNSYLLTNESRFEGATPHDGNTFGYLYSWSITSCYSSEFSIKTLFDNDVRGWIMERYEDKYNTDVSWEGIKHGT